MQQPETSIEIGDRFEVGQSRRGMLPRFQPLRHRAIGVTRASQVMGEQFWLAFYQIAEIALEHLPYACVQLLSPRAQQSAVGGILNQSVLKQIRGLWRLPATEQQARLRELCKASLEFGLGSLRYSLDQVVAELATQDRADLGNILWYSSDSVQARNQRGVKGSGNGERWSWASRQHCGYPIVLIGPF